MKNGHIYHFASKKNCPTANGRALIKIYFKYILYDFALLQVERKRLTLSD